MERNRPQISLTAILIVVTTFGVVFASWTSNARYLVMPMAGAFLGAFLVRYGFYLGLGLAFAIAFLNARLLETGPANSGRADVVVAYQVIVFAIPVIFAAWLGSKLQALLWAKSLPADPTNAIRSGQWLEEEDSPE